MVAALKAKKRKRVQSFACKSKQDDYYCTTKRVVFAQVKFLHKLFFQLSYYFSFCFNFNDWCKYSLLIIKVSFYREKDYFSALREYESSRVSN